MTGIEALALAIWMECRSCDQEVDRVAVAHVIMNRVEDQEGEFRNRNTVEAVISQPGHFPWYDKNTLQLDNTIERDAWKNAKSIAKIVYNGHTIDPTNGAMWFHRNDVSFEWTQFLEKVYVGSNIHYFWVQR